MSNYAWEKSYPPGVTWELEIPHQTLQQMLDESAATYGGKNFLDFLDRKITFAQVKELSDRAAKGFQALGVKPGVHVGLYLPNTPHYIIAFFGILKAGGTVVNYSPLDAERELEHKIADSETDFLVTLDLKLLYPKMKAMLGKTRLKKLIVGSVADYLPFPKNLLYPLAKKADFDAVANDAQNMRFKALLANDGKYKPYPLKGDTWDEVAVLQYTGGTTGLPKAAMLTHGCIMSAMTQISAWAVPYTTAGTERVVLVLPLFHIYALSAVMLAAAKSGNELIMYPRPDLNQMMIDIPRKKITMLPGVPTLFTGIINHPKVKETDLHSLKFCSSGGAPLPIDVQTKFEDMTGALLGEGYGLTETSPSGTVTPMDKAVRRPGSCGVPLPATVIEIRDLEDANKLLPVGKEHVGEVCIIGPQIMKGYWKKDDETAKVLYPSGINNWTRLHTGDTGYMDADGWLFLVDRKKDLIISSGYNVYPRVIEEACYEHPAVEECIAIGIFDQYKGEAPKVFIKLKPGKTLTFEELKAHLATRVGKMEMPVAMEIRAELPKTPVGKLSKKELKAEEAAKHKAAAAQ